MAENIFGDSILTALTGSYPGQNDPDVCPRCGGHRSWYKEQLSHGEIVLISCPECSAAIRAWWEKRENVNVHSKLN